MLLGWRDNSGGGREREVGLEVGRRRWVSSECDFS